jgi:hypothetical protein
VSPTQSDGSASPVSNLKAQAAEEEALPWARDLVAPRRGM